MQKENLRGEYIVNVMHQRAEIIKTFWVIVGGVLFAAGVNLFIVPLDLYSCGVVGIAQVIRTILIEYVHLPIPATIDVSGIISFMINVPLFLLAFHSISRIFFLRTVLCVIAQTIALTLIPIPAVPIMEDVLASCIVGGVIGGFGIGMALRNTGCGGGLDILGMFLTQKKPDFSVGKLYLSVNSAVYVLCAILFHLETAIYSVIYLIAFSMMMDKTHYQNINMTAMIFTKNAELQKMIMKETGRGVTYWKGAGAYTDTETHILVTVINKYEETKIKKVIETFDPQAFVIYSEGMSISGNFEKRL